MTRVSENSLTASLKNSINKTKTRLEDLQIKGSTLKNINRPSDGPINNVEALSISSLQSDDKQFLRNSDYALLHLNVTEKIIEELTEILGKAKEIAIAQASDVFGPDIRKNVAEEVRQLRLHALSLANKRIGQKYIFSGFKTLTTPFDANGTYQGDRGAVNLEISKDFFVPINLNGHEVFYSNTHPTRYNANPVDVTPEDILRDQTPDEIIIDTNNRELASIENTHNVKAQPDNIFSELEKLTYALENNNKRGIQNFLEEADASVSRLITLRTRIGSITKSIESTKSQIESDKVDREARKSQLIDADVAELFADLEKQRAILQTTYKASQGMISQKLLDFLR